MEKQTVGQFLSALRRSNGFTQQDIAEKLGVSNKTVSCWERDAYSPDISVIPALAEIYGVTCDEILRARRSPSAVVSEGASNNSSEERSEKEASAVFRHKAESYENSQKIAISSVLFASLTAIVISFIVEQYTGIRLLAFSIAAPVVFISCFVLIIVNYRLNFALSDDKRAFEYKKRMFRRKNKALNILVILFAALLPYGIYINYNFKYYLFSVAFAVVACMIVTVAELSRRVKKPQYYSPLPVKSRKALLTLSVVLFVAALASTFAYGTTLPKRYEIVYGEDQVVICKSLDELTELLERRTLPDCYKEVKVIVEGNTNNIIEYEVPPNDFNERDLALYPTRSINSDDNGQSIRVVISYPVWNVDYEYRDPESGEKKTGTKSICVYNENYQTSYRIDRSDQSYEVHTLTDLSTPPYSVALDNSNDYWQMLFGAVAAAIAFSVLGITYAAVRIHFKKHNKINTDAEKTDEAACEDREGGERSEIAS